MRIQLAICSESTSVDMYTAKLSIFNVLGKISALSFPMWIPDLSLTLALERESEPVAFQGKIKVTLGENEVHESDLALNFSDDEVARTVICFSLAIPSPGVLSFRITGEGVDVEVYRLPVVQIKIENDDQSSASPSLPHALTQ